MRYHKPRVYRLKGTVGACGTNNPEDVKRTTANDNGGRVSVSCRKNY